GPQHGARGHSAKSCYGDLRAPNGSGLTPLRHSQSSGPSNGWNEDGELHERTRDSGERGRRTGVCYCKGRRRKGELMACGRYNRGYNPPLTARKLGWVEGFEPSATGTTIQRSTS